ncbi:MAG TPA: putative sulfate exporter family transporter, partial [Mucilaginibacter sp.]
MLTPSTISHPNGLFLNTNPNISKVIFISCLLLCLTPFISPAVALLMGLIVAQFTGHPYLHLNHK